MTELLASPAFGQADLTNCERELIHLAGSIQPHGVLLVVDEPRLTVLQASENAPAILGLSVAQLLERTLDVLGGNIFARISAMIATVDLAEPKPLRCNTACADRERELEGTVHRHPGGGLIVELEPLPPVIPGAHGAAAGARSLQEKIENAVLRFSGAISIASLSDAVVQCFRELAGYDRVMVYKFDPDGHGEIIAEAREPRLDSLLGHHYPASDIPHRARELYVRNRARVLVDAGYAPVPLVPRVLPGTQQELDMSLCSLRSMSPLHIQYLKNMGVTATLVVSLVREGSLWGLIACHHYSPRHVDYPVRAASEFLAEVIATRIAALENYVQGQVEVLLRRLELRLIDATSTEGDWRLALFQNPRTLLQPFEATGAALFYDGDMMTAGDVPSTQELRALVHWISDRAATEPVDSVFSCSSVERANPGLQSISSTASGVLAVALSSLRPDYLLWFRAEQVAEVKWAGDPAKPVVADDPNHLSPRRSFAVWSEIVRGSSIPWTKADTTLARAIGASLADFILQVQVVRLLITQHQMMQVRTEVVNSKEAVIIADQNGQILFSNEPIMQLLRRPGGRLDTLDQLAECFTDSATVGAMLGTLRDNHAPWRGELAIAAGHGGQVSVRARADVVPGPMGTVLGFMLILNDLTESKNAEAALRHFETEISQTERAETLLEPGSRLLREPDQIIKAILANANLAAMEITDAVAGASVIPLLEELEVSTKRAALLYRQFRDYTRGN